MKNYSGIAIGGPLAGKCIVAERRVHSVPLRDGKRIGAFAYEFAQIEAAIGATDATRTMDVWVPAGIDDPLTFAIGEMLNGYVKLKEAGDGVLG